MAGTADSICLSCGLCCDGSLFRYVAIAPDDRIDVLRSAGALLVQAGDETQLRQRCAALEGTCCTVYSDRPGGCAAFTCALYRRHEAGEITTAAALATIADARELQRRVHDGLATMFGENDVSTSGRSFADLVTQLNALLDTAPDREAMMETHIVTLMQTKAFDQRMTRLFFES